MGLFGIGKKKRRDSDYHAISLDIGTEFVKALIFRVEKDTATIIGVGRQRQRLADMHGGMVTDIQGVIRNCEAALGEAAEQAKTLPDQVVIGIAGELVKGTMTTVRYIRPDSQAQIDFAELKEIIGKVHTSSFERARSILALETGHQEVDVKLVNAAITDVEIDSYKVTNPLGFQGKEVQVGIFNAFAPVVHLGALQTIADRLDLDLLAIAAEPYAVARVLGPDEGNDFSAIFIDVGGGTTDIAVVSQGGVEGTKMFALGGRAFTKRIANQLGESFLEAERKKLKYSAGKLEDETKRKVKQAIEADCQVWFAGVELTLGDFTGVDLLPSRIYLCGGGSKLPDIKQTLEKAVWSRSLPFARRPTIHYLKPSEIPRVKDTTGEIIDVQDVTPMALANLGIELVGSEGMVEAILSKTVKSLRA
ncbi:MAG TPA: cell division FtsA domain-containing protein [bacterium]|jgi:cell division protein FtsA|nr:cell division FtsA domain-containing protein [bacterium]HOR57193.1 cell division FtsA domain-containing protein [bacterium]HPL56204.1 cell division FtsA domain-containing protein [bacterium]HPM27621.1 cell division FtsA domain-containing protein [bacterium]